MQRSWKDVTPAQQRALRWALWIADQWYRRTTQTVVLREDNLDITPGSAFLTNHTSVWNSFFWGWIVFRRFVESHPYLMPLNVYKKKWYTRMWPVTSLLQLWRTVPVMLNGGTNISAYRSVVDALHGGAVVHLFPEGTRSCGDSMLPLKRSPCATILQADASIQVAYCLARKRTRVVALGQKIAPDAVRKLAGDGPQSQQALALRTALQHEFALLRTTAIEYDRRRQ